MGDEKDMRATLSLVPAAAEREEGDAYALVMDYLMGALTPNERARVELRLEHDPAFSRIAAPIIAAWENPAFGAALANDGGDRVATAPNGVAWTDLCQRIEAEGGDLGDDRSSDAPDRQADIELPDDVTPAPWYEVLPLSWLLRVGLTAAAALATAGWIIAFVIRHRGP